MNIIFIAPPAAGKGTVSSLLATNYGYEHISTGELLRKEINSGSELGQEVKEIIDKGELVGDELITKMLTKELTRVANAKFILDGYPRNVAQAETLNQIFNNLGITDYLAIYLAIDEDLATKRALGRIICSKCGSTYNKYFTELSPKKEGICDKCGEKLVTRSEDNESTFKVRYQTYLQQTAPVLDYYQKINKLVTIDSSRESDEVFNSIKEIIGVSKWLQSKILKKSN